jgi:hypothetical protein
MIRDEELAINNLVYMVFLSQADEERGFTLLLQRTPVQAYAQGVYGVDRNASRLLDEQEVRYRQATQEEISSNVAGRAVRDPAAHPLLRLPTHGRGGLLPGVDLEDKDLMDR